MGVGKGGFLPLQLAPPLWPSADDEDNFVVGLGVDRTCTGIVVQHPTDPNAPDLPPQPVLLVRVFDARPSTRNTTGRPSGALNTAVATVGAACLHRRNRNASRGFAAKVAPPVSSILSWFNERGPPSAPRPSRWPPRMACCDFTPLAAWTAQPAAPPPASWRRPSRCLPLPRWLLLLRLQLDLRQRRPRQAQRRARLALHCLMRRASLKRWGF